MDTTHLEQATAAAKRAFEAWPTAREGWHGVRGARTSRDGRVLGAEAIDLASRMGRLTCGDPDWAPRPHACQPPRPVADLTFDREQLATVLAGLQRLADVSARLAVKHSRVVDIQAARRQLLVPTRTLRSDVDIPRPSAPAPTHRTNALCSAYEEAGAAAGDRHRKRQEARA